MCLDRAGRPASRRTVAFELTADERWLTPRRRGPRSPAAVAAGELTPRRPASCSSWSRLRPHGGCGRVRERLARLQGEHNTDARLKQRGRSACRLEAGQRGAPEPITPFCIAGRPARRWPQGPGRAAGRRVPTDRFVYFYGNLRRAPAAPGGDGPAPYRGSFADVMISMAGGQEPIEW